MENELSDERFIELAARIINDAQETGDPRIMALVQTVLDEMHRSDALPTVLLRYHHLINDSREALDLQLEPRVQKNGR